MRRFLRHFSLSVLLCSLAFAGIGCRTVSQEVVDRSKPITLEYWGVFDDADAFSGILASYRQLHPNIRVNYRKFRFDEYEKALLQALAEDRGPDIISLHNTWMTRWEPRLLAVPTTLTVPYVETRGTLKKQQITVLRQEPGVTPRQVTSTFVPQVAQDAVIAVETGDPKTPLVRRVFGLPLSVDTLALFYNRTLLNNAGIAAPATHWKEFQEQAKKLTRLDQTGAVIQSGAALGTAANVERAGDILSNLMLQNGAVMTDQNGVAAFDKYPADLAARPLPPGAEALVFYTDFANPAKEVYSWNERFPNSVEAFAKGQAAYLFGYAYHAPAIRAANANLNFSVAPFPQIEGNQPVYFANYWLQTVSKKTKHPDEAWDFIQFSADPKNVASYLKITKKPAALTALLEAQKADPDLSVFASQVPAAKSWYHGADPVAAEQAFADMIRQMLADEADPKKILTVGATKVNQTLR